MTLDVTIIVPTFGDDRWAQMARDRAIPSAERLGVTVVHAAGTSLADARNRGLALVTTEWVIHLDADDELEPGYIAAMAEGSADVRAPSHRFCWQGKPQRIKMPKVAGHRHMEPCTAECLPDGNWVGVGACVRTELLRSVGGWPEAQYAEDWWAWGLCWQAGGTFEPIHKAVYRVHVSAKSRMRGLSRSQIVEGHNEVAAALGFPLVK